MAVFDTSFCITDLRRVALKRSFPALRFLRSLIKQIVKCLYVWVSQMRLSMPLKTLRIAKARITEHKLDVDGFSKNNVENNYAVGDVLYQKPELTAAVIEEGRIVTDNFFIEFKRLKKT